MGSLENVLKDLRFGARTLLRHPAFTIVAVALAAVGMALGTAAAALVTRVLAPLLYGVSAVDPVAFGAAALVLLAVALLANAVPAWHASRADPMVALRYE